MVETVNRSRADKDKKECFAILGRVVALAQILVSIILIVLIIRLGVMPAGILAVILFIVLMLAEITVLGCLLGRKRRMLRISSCVLGIFLISTLSVFSAYVWKSDDFIKTIGSGSEEKLTISVVVLDSSWIDTLNDMKSGSFAYVKKGSNSVLSEGIREIKSILGPITTQHPDNNTQLTKLLYNGECDAIVIEDASRSQIAESFDDFDSRTRTVWTYEVSRHLPVSEEGLDVTQNSFNIFLCGSDSRESVDEVALNDLNMIVTVNPVTHQILLTSIPRDYYLELASYSGSDKLTHVGVYGTEEAMRTVEKFTGLKMDFYVKVSFAALVYVVDAMGGIDVESDTEFTAWTNPDVHIVKGMNHMDGVTALAYARERFAYEDGDIHRAQNQAQVLRETAWKAMSPGILIHYDKLLDALEMGMKTNISDAQIRSLIKMQLQEAAQWDIRDYQMNGTGDLTDKCYSMWGHELYIMIPDETTVYEALDRINQCMKGEIPYARGKDPS